MDESISIDQQANEKCRAPCQNCGRETHHLILKSVDLNRREYDDRREYDYSLNWWDKNSFQIIQCLGCDALSFRKIYTNSENIDGDPSTGETWLDEDVAIFPNRVAGRHKLRQADFLPRQVARIYDETHAALCGRQPILAGIGIRALVEAVCQEEQATGKNLEQKIDNLVALEILTKYGAEMLHSTRLLGNAAAHEVKPHPEKTLNLAMDVVEHLLTDVYILPNVTDGLPKRKKLD